MAGTGVPCQFKNLSINCNAARMICKNLNAKLSFKKMAPNTPFQVSDIEQICNYDRSIAYFIRFYLRDILTSDHGHVWFNIQTKSLDSLENRKHMMRKPSSKEIQVVYSFGAMLDYRTFIEHTDERSLARIYVQKSTRAIKLQAHNHCLTMPLEDIDAQVLINHSTDDESVHVVFMLKASPAIEQLQEKNDRKHRLSEELGLCSDLLVRFFPASDAWAFLHDLPIAGYSKRSADELFHLNFSLFEKRKHSNVQYPLGMPQHAPGLDAYGMEMLWSLGYLFRDKYNLDCRSVSGTINQQKKLYDVYCTMWNNLKSNHCYQLQDAWHDDSVKKSSENVNESSQSKTVAFAILTPHRTEYQPMHVTLGHRGFEIYPPEDWLLIHMRDYSGKNKLMSLDDYTRIYFKKLMTKGIARSGRQFRYFGSSGSQMNNQAGWFLALPQGETMETAREKLGNLSTIHNVATYIARVGLYLTTSKCTEIKLTYRKEISEEHEHTSSRSFGFMSLFGWPFSKRKKENIEYNAWVIPDKELHGFCFTDGCGKISLGLAKEVARRIGIRIQDKNDIPSAFQVRIAGCKGMLSIDPKSTSKDFYVKVRKSMIKFDAEDWTIHVVDYSRPKPLSLNNQVIRLLSDLGNSHGVFESLQSRCIDTRGTWHPPAGAYLNVVESTDQSVMNERREKYNNVRHLLLRNKIPLPVNEARCLFGIADETGKLQAGECFIQYRNLENRDSTEYTVVEGSVLVTKNPCLNPGDIRKLQAVMVPALCNCVRDCIVFSIHGYRPSCNEMAGSDLDGDEYWVYWGEELRIENVAHPLSYPAASKSSVPSVTNELIVDHILDTMIDKAPGVVANTHSAIADKHPMGTRSEECKECALLFARAIDARKTGENITMNRIKALKEKYCQNYPAWMRKFDKPSMDPPSTSINEILYQKAQEAQIRYDDCDDILRPLTNIGQPMDAVAIDLDDRDRLLEEETSIEEKPNSCNESGCCCVF